MGKIRRYSCKCGYEEELWIGRGFMAKNLDAVKRCIPEESFAPFYEAYSAGEVSDFLLGMTIARCKSCKRLVSVNVLSYTLPPEINNSPETEPGNNTDENGEDCDNAGETPPEEIRYINACPHCGGEVNEEKDIERIRCPKCRGKMYYQEIGNWD